jgi:hypothetical protein
LPAAELERSPRIEVDQNLPAFTNLILKGCTIEEALREMWVEEPLPADITLRFEITMAYTCAVCPKKKLQEKIHMESHAVAQDHLRHQEERDYDINWYPDEGDREYDDDFATRQNNMPVYPPPPQPEYQGWTATVIQDNLEALPESMNNLDLNEHKE